MEQVCAALEKLLNEKCSSTPSLRHRNMRIAAEKVLLACSAKFDVSAATAFVSAIEDCFPADFRRSASNSVDKAQSTFHFRRITVLPPLCFRFLQTTGVTVSDSLFSLSLMQKLFDDVLLKKINKVRSELQPSRAIESVSDTMSIDEQNAVRYAAGYIPFKLLKRYQQDSSEKALAFCSCLRAMEVPDEEELLQVVGHIRSDHHYSFSDYTASWLEMIDRGALFKLSDMSFKFFYYIEIKVQSVLPSHLKSQSSTKDEIVSAVMNDNDVKKQWDCLSADIDIEELSTSLVIK